MLLSGQTLGLVYILRRSRYSQHMCTSSSRPHSL